MALPRITIVTPSYNQAPFLEQTMQSVLSQGYPNLEYIVLDGGSTDGSVEIIRRRQASLAYWRSEPDKGQSAALQEGFARASGDVLAWLNSDDWYAPGALNAVGEAFASGDVDIVYGDLRFTDVAGRRLFDGHLVLDERVLAYEAAFPAQPSLFWSRDVYQRAGGIDPSFRFAMDYDLLVRMVRSGARSKKLRRVLAHFRNHPQSKTSNMAAVGDEEVAIVRARYGYDRGSPLRKFIRTWAVRLGRFARDPRCLLSAVESRLKT